MAIRTDGWPAVEAMVTTPDQEKHWPIANQVVVLPFHLQNHPQAERMNILQVVIVPRANWERITAHVPADVLQREGVANG
ncbi:hypothetical protein JY409_03340 [Stenotrophomonas maltophilia]|uniref:hypothetical protein n=1 Tax=Stenotrophomonas maltophilia TaxID=40324 RepID=UPI000AAABDFA|nr:hypothetical protein [Stenotrophomonas maltophilia]MBN4937077.1 hypothetical protein [Stenotrophomonas maltophilia]HEL3749983.1 hypothetical protein [Stenotrophomonas maltophilia]HEL7728502.1 hypothetical protein [Stenotrophomonas maltophilia]